MGFAKLLVQPHWAFNDSGNLPELLGGFFVGFWFWVVFLFVWSSNAREVAIKMVFKCVSGTNFDQTKWKKVCSDLIYSKYR